MKKLLVILLAATMVLTFVACKEEKAEYKLGMGIVLSMDNSYDKSDEKDAKARVDATYAAVVLDKDGKIVAIDLDASETEVSVANGKLLDLDSVGLSTKKELKDKYSMKKHSGIGKEWYEQADAFCSKCVGKTIAEIAGLMGTDKKGTEDVINAGCTIVVDEFVSAASKIK